MAKKGPNRRTLRSFFSRSEANLDQSVPKEEKNEGEKKRFRLPRFLSRSKGSSSGPEKANGSAEVLSAAEPAEDAEAWTENRTSLYATAPRSKSKEFSYSEMDLRKPKRFSTFSFGLRRKKRKEDENISKSTFALDDPAIDEQEETTLDLSQMELDQTDMRDMFSMSQPELVACKKFNIPRLPLMATVQSESLSADPDQPLAAEEEEEEEEDVPLPDGSSEPKAPIASMPEFDDDSVRPPTPPPAPPTPSLPPVDPPTPGVTEALVEVHSPAEVLQATETPPESPSVSPPTEDPPALSDSSTTSDPRPDAKVVESNLVPSEVLATVPRSQPPAVGSSADGGSEGGQEVVYGVLYETLFPRSFTSEVMSSLSNSPPPPPTPPLIHTTRSEPVKTLEESHAETNTVYSCLSPGAGAQGDPASLESSNSSLPYPQKSAMTSKDVPYSELTLSGGPSLNTVGSVASVGNPAPPAPACAPSQGTGARVTDSKQRVILVKEVVTEEAGVSSGCSSPALDKMSVTEALEIKTEVAETFYVPSSARQAEESEGPQSPAYLSVGSDDGSTMEVYYSAEESNGEESGQEEEEMYTIDERDEGIEAGKEWGDEAKGLEDEGEYQLVIVKVKNEESNVDVVRLQEPRGLAEQEFGARRLELPQITEEEEPREEEGEGERAGEELLATPVGQVLECEAAPPSAEPPRVQGRDRDRAEAFATEAHPKRDEQPETGHLDVERIFLTQPAREEEEEEVEEKEDVRSDRRAEEWRITGAEVVRGSAAADATEIDGSEWVDTSRGSPDKKAEREQVTVELSSSVDTQPPPEPPGESDRDPGSPTCAEVLTSAAEGSESPSDRMASFSTKLTIKPRSPPQEDESKRFHKVSLISETDGGGDAANTVESNGTDVASEYRWKNRFQGASQYTSYKPPDSSEAQAPSLSDTYSSSSYSSSSFSSQPESTTYKGLSDTLTSSPALSTVEERFSDRLQEGIRVHLSRESEPAGEPGGEWRRRGLVLLREEEAEPGAPVTERERQSEGAEAERVKSRWDSEQFSSSFSDGSTLQRDDVVDNGGDSGDFTGLFKATLVDLVPEPAAPPSTPPASPDGDASNQFDMDNLVDTLKNMEPSFRPRAIGFRPPVPNLVSSLPSIREDTLSPLTPNLPLSVTSAFKQTETTETDSRNGMYTLPPDIGLKRSTPRDNRSPLELLKTRQLDEQSQSGPRGMNLPLRASATNSIVLRNSSDSSPDDLKSPVFNGNGVTSPTSTGSRLDNSIIFGSLRSASIDQTVENGKSHRSLFRTSSLPDAGYSSNDRMSTGSKELGDGAGSRFERFSFLANSSSGSLSGADDPNGRMSRPPGPLSFGSPPANNSPNRVLSPSSDLHRPFFSADPPQSMFGQTPGMGMGMGMGLGMGTGTSLPPLLQRSLSSEGSVGVQQNSMFSNGNRGPLFQNQQEPEPDNNLLTKYRAFPDAYLTKTKEHGKLNPRPGKMYIFDRPGMCGQRIEVRSDIMDATSWELQETISIRVVRGGWVMYEKPNYKGEKVALDEGDIELTCPFSPPEEEAQGQQEVQVQQNGEKEKGEGEEQNGETSEGQAENTPPPPPRRKFIIGSLRRAVRDYSVPEISLFPEENAEGKKVVFRDTSADARIYGFPVKATSIIINAGLWLVYAQPFFQGVPRVLEVGGYPTPAAWGVEQPYVGSVHPLKVGEPRVENLSEPKLVIYDKPYFCGKSRTISNDMKDFITRMDRQQTVFMYTVGSLKVQGGIWVGYEKEGFRGHQYLLEEGEYQDWRVWGGCDAELRSIRLIRADLTEPMLVMFEQQEEEEAMHEENTFEVTEAIPDVELFEYKTSTRSIQVFSGAWVAYSHVDFSGNQYILEKGFYNNCADWGSLDNRICSVQPILLAPRDGSTSGNEIVLYDEPDFQGKCNILKRNQDVLTDKFQTKSCRVVGGSWVLYENEKFTGNLYVLHEGDYPNLSSMGCPPTYTVRSVKVVPTTFSVPSISMFGLECLEGREITTETEIISMAAEGLNNHILSVRVNSGSWVLCEHSNYRGRQFLLEPIEITNWPKFSSLNKIGSVYPVRQRRQFFRIKNTESGLYMSVQGGVEEMKSGRVVVSEQIEPMSDVWFYQDGLIKSKLSSIMSLQVMGGIEPAAKVVLWTESRQPIQNWTAQMSGLITSLTYPGMVLDVKGGKTYDKDHVVIMPENDERPSQQWQMELL